jgi:formate--tetrahydrofolate ligase
MTDPSFDIVDIGARLGVPATALRPYGRDKAKLELAALGPLAERGALVLVSGITPTAAGEGKTTTAIGLADGLTRLGRRAAVVLREPSLGPIFGQKGGGTGFGRSRLVPTADINLHFTGDFHAIASAHNLLAALIDNHLHHGLTPTLDPERITWKRTMDMNDRALRQLEVGRGKGNGPVRAGGFDITAASEIMAILALADGPDDLRARLGRIVIGRTVDGRAATAADVGAVGSMMALLRDAMLPNLVATHEGTPAIVHCGPFANIAHGTASVVAMKAGLHLAEVSVVECGFGFDLGGEKFFDLVARGGPLSPAAVVIIASLRALRLHGGVAPDRVATPDLAAVQAGLPNLLRHLDNARLFGRPVVIALNAFAGDSAEEVAAVRAAVTAADAGFAVIDAPARGADGGVELAQLVLDTLAAHPQGRGRHRISSRRVAAHQARASRDQDLPRDPGGAVGRGHRAARRPRGRGLGPPAGVHGQDPGVVHRRSHPTGRARWSHADGAALRASRRRRLHRRAVRRDRPHARSAQAAAGLRHRSGRRRDRRRRLTAIDRAIGHAAQARRARRRRSVSHRHQALDPLGDRRVRREPARHRARRQRRADEEAGGGRRVADGGAGARGRCPSLELGQRASPGPADRRRCARRTRPPPYSREREIARRMRVAAIGATMMSASVPRSPGPSRSSRAPPKASAPHCTAGGDERHHRGQHGRDRRDQDVAVVDVGQLVGDHPAQLALGQERAQAGGHRDHAVARIAGRSRKALGAGSSMT